MGDLTRNFSRIEFACRCGCGRNTVDYQTLVHLQYERDYFGQRMHITSGYRCPSHNQQVGGGKKSQHLYGRAVDHWIEGIDPVEQFKYFNTRWPNRYGIGLYIAQNFLHFDTRDGPAARWTGKGDTVTL